ncbi:MAG: hypothetical protein ACTHK2_11710 [Dokdonella sp.]|uniref:hypothetical protein n=1 Tax=Dokdonella sp. TaxID=2291710 RepID=UPI003F7D034E
MPRKKSIKGSADWFAQCAGEIDTFLSAVSERQSAEHVSWLHGYAIIKLYRTFESFVLDCLIGAINNDTGTLSAKAGIAFPKHLTDEVCEYIIIGQGYFDFKGRDGLIKTIKGYVQDDHYLKTVKQKRYKEALEQLTALRNYAAHESFKSKKAALDAIGAKRIGAAGSWLKRKNRYSRISEKLKEIAAEVRSHAPY